MEPKPHDVREWKRMRACWDLHRHGWRHCVIAEALNVAEESVSRWVSRAKRDGPSSLLAHAHPGCPPRLTEEQRRLIPDFLWHGAEAYGFHGELWTCGRVAAVLKDEFGVSFHPGHVSRILKELGWTPQVPITKAIQRNEDEIDRWRREVWPELVLEARRERRTLVFVDESGFYLHPSVVRTYAPQGETPELHVWQTRDHLSVMGGVTLSGRFYTLARQKSLNGLHTIAFLNHILHFSKRWLVIWDRSPIHRRREVQDYVEQLPKRPIRIEFLPPYAPDLNPVEWVWRHLKYVEMRNLVCRDLEEIHEEFHMALGRLRGKPRLFDSFFQGPRLETPSRKS